MSFESSQAICNGRTSLNAQYDVPIAELDFSSSARLTTEAVANGMFEAEGIKGRLQGQKVVWSSMYGLRTTT